jgi:ABC-type sugar transport system permease subunit
MLDNKKTFPYFFTLPLVITLLCFVLYPFLYLFYMAFSQNSFPFVTLAKFKDSFLGIRFFKHLQVSATYIVCSTIGTVILGFLIAFLINTIDRGKTVFQLIFLVPLAIAPVVVAYTWKTLLDPLRGIVNYLMMLIGLPLQAWLSDPNLAPFSIMAIAIWRFTPLAVLILYSGLLTIQPETIEASAVEGANRWQQLWHIYLPLSLPFLVVSTFLEFLMIFKEFELTYILTRGGPDGATETFIMRTYLEGFQWYNFENAATLSIIILVVGTVIARYGYNLIVKQQEQFFRE